MIARIAITGAPGSGKTKLLDHLKSDPAFRHFVFFDELARQLLMQNPAFRTDRLEFHRQIYYRQVAREDAVESTPFMTDRGTVDAFAFHPDSLADVGTTLEREYRRYTAVVHLGSTARLGAEHYKTDDVRNESPADALAIEKALQNAWQEHPDYHFIEAVPDWNEKLGLCRSLLFRLGGVTEGRQPATRHNEEDK